MQDVCIKSNCGNAASKCCGSCGGVWYCSSECQKDDWKEVHKSECVDVKKLSAIELTGAEIVKVANKMLKAADRLGSSGLTMRAVDSLEKCVVFARHHLRDSIPGKQYFILRNGTEVDNEMICHIYESLVIFYASFSQAEHSDRMLPFVSEARRLLVDMEDAGMDIEIESLRQCDALLGWIYSDRGEMGKSVYHHEQSLASARQCKGPNHISIICDAMMILSHRYAQQDGRLPEALSLAEEAYTIASEVYSPVHREVQGAAVAMIDCLFCMKDYSRAETYCRINYENLTDPIHKNEYDEGNVSIGMYQLAHVWLMKEPDDDEIVAMTLAEEAEDLIRKAYNLMRTIDEAEASIRCLKYLHCFALILLKRKRWTEETEGIIQQCVSEGHKICGSDSVAYYESLSYLGTFYECLSDSLPIGEEKILVREKAELCRMKSCADRSIKHIAENYTKQKITPYFSNNEEIYI